MSLGNPEMLRIVDAIARDRKIEREDLFIDLEMAMISAARKFFGSLDSEEFRCHIDRLTGQTRLWRRVASEWDEETGEPIGDLQEIEIDIAKLGRIPAQTAKQVMIQRFREDERASISAEFSKRLGELVTGTAQRYEGSTLVVQVDRAEGYLPRGEQIPGEQFHPGDRVRCMILDVREVGSQVRIILTRAQRDFIRRLFEVEVPEVSERIIEIKAMAREPGSRTKLAVSSIDSKVDAVGACVGVRGSRIKNIVDELGGEKIDIVRWNDSSQILIQNALKPAEVRDVSLCFELGRATVIVENDQLSLAIGKRGQNVRLAAQLAGWDIDILTPDEYAKGLEILVDTLNKIPDLSESLFDRLAALGMISVFDVEEVGPKVLVDELEVEPELAEQMVRLAADRARVVQEEQEREKAEAERRKAEESEVASGVLDLLGGGAGGVGGEGDADGEAGDAAGTDSEADQQAASILGGGGESDSDVGVSIVVEMADEPEADAEADEPPVGDDAALSGADQEEQASTRE
ncbi:MAG: transcription termination factor NusA [Planctomycetes bacterium]|nr:transcription termination factor NusA [Planctomycetota bacterium]NOG53375.1 transcription termination factor NusA [Planctomycetota bacterium]